MPNMSKILGYSTAAAAYLFGVSSLLFLGVFLYRGPFFVVDFDLPTAGALGLNGALCLAFFVQHSGMVRKPFRRRLKVFVPEDFHSAIYAIASGAVLWVLFLLWQPTEVVFFRADGLILWLLRGAYFLTILGLVWSLGSLGAFDVFGTRQIGARLHGKTLKTAKLTIQGPYKWVRHPLYALFLVLLWSYPELTADRLLLNVSWTIWIFVGSVLEERDLVSEFGESYQEYQRQVPMLIPLRIPRQI
jgi:protein-S-isoprenylcysteine O-methyltransferase Ste14